MSTEKSFISPHDPSLNIPNTEGWEEMYPYHALVGTSDPKRKQYESETFWLLDALHRPEPIPPFDLLWEDTRHLSMGVMIRLMVGPFSTGMDYRVINGYLYLGTEAVSNLEIIQKKLPTFQERAGYYYQNWQELYDKKWHEKMKALIDELKQIQFPDLPEIEDMSVIIEGKGLTSAHPILEAYQKMLGLAYKQWDYHIEFLLAGYGGLLQFAEMMKKLFPDISDKSIGQATSGFDAAIFRPPMELQNLAIAAVEQGTADALLKSARWEEVPTNLKQTEAGRKWLEQFESARDPWFEMSGGTGFYHTDGCWNDNLDLPLTHIKNYIEALKRGETIVKPQEEVIKERDRVTAEYRGMIKNEEDVQAFDQTLGLARLVSPFAEDHQFYCENWFQCLFYRKMRELGDFLVKYGPLEDREDIFFLHTFEVSNVLFDAVAKWYSYLTHVAKTHWPAKIKRRKEILEQFKEWTPPPALGAVPSPPLNAVFVSLMGLNQKKIDEWLKADEVKPEEVTELTGIAGSPGIIEGPARVCSTALDISTLKAGDILVAPQTSPTWAPAFNTIGGAVMDQGGLFAHASIVCREYKLPAVLGTTIGTRVIKTGDQLRVDGDNGTVTILKRAN